MWPRRSEQSLPMMQPRVEELATPEVMPSHRIQRGWKEKLKAAVPFGLGQPSPNTFATWLSSRGATATISSTAWKVLSRGVCDGCALGVAGFHDWTMDGIHLCMTRLNLLRLNTVPALDVALLATWRSWRASTWQRSAERRRGLDARPHQGAGRCSALQFDNAQLRELGRLPYPMLREKDAKGFRRITWDEAIARHRREESVSQTRDAWRSMSPRAA